jgi:peptidoglycan hydrolase-like protein with peptidoglycan-binding domain
MQEALIERGHLGGGADAIFGPRTEVALRAFQQEQELEETGVADSATVVRLLVELLPAKRNSRFLDPCSAACRSAERPAIGVEAGAG